MDAVDDSNLKKLSWFDQLLKDKRFWIGLLCTGIIMRFTAMFTSGIGLDANIHATYATMWIETGEGAFNWGALRNLEQPMANNPDTIVEPIGINFIVWHCWIVIWFWVFGRSYFTLHLASFFLSCLVLSGVWVITKKVFNNDSALKLTAIVSISPGLIQASGKFYQEEALLLIVGAIAAIIILGVEQNKKGKNPTWWFAGIPITLIFALTKGVQIYLAFFPLIVYLVFIILKKKYSIDFLVEKQKIAILISLIIGLSIVPIIHTILGAETMKYALSHPSKFILAGIIALFCMLIWIGIGMIVWPFISNWIKRIKSNNLDDSSVLLSMIVMFGFGAIWVYIAALWTYEAHLANMSIFEISWELRNNGRHAMLLFIPFHYSLLVVGKNENKEFITNLDHIEKKSMAIVLGAFIITPFILYAGIIGTDSSPEITAKKLGEMVNVNDEFLLITEPYIGSHQLYQFRLGVDPDYEKEIVGHWRTDQSDWGNELQLKERINHRGNLTNVNFLVISPDAYFDENKLPNSWKDNTTEYKINGYLIIQRN